MFVACGIWCLADVSSVSPSSEQTAPTDEGLTLETSAKHHIPQATNLPYQPLLINQAHIQRTRPHLQTVFFKTSLPAFIKLNIVVALKKCPSCLEVSGKVLFNPNVREHGHVANTCTLTASL